MSHEDPVARNSIWQTHSTYRLLLRDITPGQCPTSCPWLAHQNVETAKTDCGT